MSRILRIVPRASADVDDIFNWLVGRSLQGAISWYLAFGRAIEQIQAEPERFALAPEAPALRRELREALFKTRRGRLYRIVFLIDETEVTILRVRRPAEAPLRHQDLPRH